MKKNIYEIREKQGFKLSTKEVISLKKIYEKRGSILCDYFDKCHNIATRNIQESLITWKVSAKGEYSKHPVDYEEINGDNYHLCDDCEPNN